MELLQQYGKEIFAIAVPIITWALNSFFKSKAKLKAGNPHSFTYIIKEPLLNENREVIGDTQVANTNTLIVKNVGRETATKVEIGLNWQPQFFNVWPVRNYQTHTQEDGRFYIIFDSLSPNETVGVALLSVNRDLPAVTNIRSDQSTAQFVNMEPMEVFKKSYIQILRVFILLGFATAIYLAILLVQFLIVDTK